MRRLMVRLPDDLYHQLNNAAHDNRTSMNQWVIDVIKDKIEQ